MLNLHVLSSLCEPRGHHQLMKTKKMLIIPGYVLRYARVSADKIMKKKLDNRTRRTTKNETRLAVPSRHDHVQIMN